VFESGAVAHDFSAQTGLAASLSFQTQATYETLTLHYS
jgi:hypothetical protein